MMKIFNVKGMHCRSCEMLMKDVLEETKGVTKAKLSAKDATVTFEEKVISTEAIKSIIRKQGFEVG